MCLLLPAMALLAVVKMTRSVADNLFFIGWGAVTWTVAFYIQCRILSLYAGSWSRTTMFVWYLGTILLFLYILGHEGAWMIGGNSMPVKWQFWTVLVVWGGLLTVIVRNLIREMTSPGEKRVSVKR